MHRLIENINEPKVGGKEGPRDVKLLFPPGIYRQALPYACELFRLEKAYVSCAETSPSFKPSEAGAGVKRAQESPVTSFGRTETDMIVSRNLRFSKPMLVEIMTADEAQKYGSSHKELITLLLKRLKEMKVLTAKEGYHEGWQGLHR